jgi:hypothetical protein
MPLDTPAPTVSSGFGAIYSAGGRIAVACLPSTGKEARHYSLVKWLAEASIMLIPPKNNPNTIRRKFHLSCKQTTFSCTSHAQVGLH